MELSHSQERGSVAKIVRKSTVARCEEVFAQARASWLRKGTDQPWQWGRNTKTQKVCVGERGRVRLSVATTHQTTATERSLKGAPAGSVVLRSTR